MSKQRFYLSADGEYLGGFVGCEPPAGAIEVPQDRPSADHVWDGLDWVLPTKAAARQKIADLEQATPITHRKIREALLEIAAKAGVDVNASTALKAVQQADALIRAERAKL